MPDANPIRHIQKIERSPKGLASALFDSMDQLNAGVITVEQARALSTTARVIVGVARLEIDAARTMDAMGKRVKFATLPGLGDGLKQLEQKPVDESGDKSGNAAAQ